MKFNNEEIIRKLNIEELELLPQTRDFFDLKETRAIPIFLFIIISLVIIFFVWISFAQVDDVVKASAVTRPMTSISSVKVLCSGQILEKNYIKNQIVQKGDLLLKFDDSALILELENSLTLLAQQKKDLDENINMIELLENYKNFSKNLSSSLTYQLFYTEYQKYLNSITLAQTAYEKELNAPESLKIQKNIEEALLKYEQVKFEFETWLSSELYKNLNLRNQYNQNIKTLENKIAVIEQNIKNCSVYSPIDGEIDEIYPLNVGDYILAATEIIKVVPKNDFTLKAEIIVDAAKIPRLKEGQIVNLRFPGLPPSSFGQVSSVINSIPVDMKINDDGLFFEVEAIIDNPFLVSKQGEKIKLRPGIVAEARIIIARDSVLKMILRKLDFIN